MIQVLLALNDHCPEHAGSMEVRQDAEIDPRGMFSGIPCQGITSLCHFTLLQAGDVFTYGVIDIQADIPGGGQVKADIRILLHGIGIAGKGMACFMALVLNVSRITLNGKGPFLKGRP
jgi:hypothetical protein